MGEIYGRDEGGRSELYREINEFLNSKSGGQYTKYETQQEGQRKLTFENWIKEECKSFNERAEKLQETITAVEFARPTEDRPEPVYSWADIFRGRLLKASFKEEFPEDYRKSYETPDKRGKPDEKPEEKKKRENNNTLIGGAVDKRDGFFGEYKDDEKLFGLFKNFEEKVQRLDKPSGGGRKEKGGDSVANILREREQLFTTLIGYVAGRLYFELRPIYVWWLAKDALDGPKGLLKADLSEVLTATATVEAKWPTDEKSKPRIVVGKIKPGKLRPSVPSKSEPPSENKKRAGDSSLPQPTPQSNREEGEAS